MTTLEEVALLRAILTNPEDDTARLVYADWLQENAGTVPCPKCLGTGSHALDPYQLAQRYGTYRAGKILDAAVCESCHGTGSIPDGRADRAEFIRVQCDIASWGMCDGHAKGLHGPGDPRCPECDRRGALRRRERELLKPRDGRSVIPFWTTFNLPNRDMVYGIDQHIHGTPSRGFIGLLTCSAADWLQHADTLFWHPTQTVECPHCKGQQHVIYFKGPGATSPNWKDCPACTGTGHTIRPFVPTAQPLTQVTLTTIPAVSGWATGHAWLTDDPQRERFPCPHPSDTGMDLRGIAKLLLEAQWPGITFELSVGTG